MSQKTGLEAENRVMEFGENAGFWAVERGTLPATGNRLDDLPHNGEYELSQPWNQNHRLP
jgi:hypothetical protein